MFKKSGNYAIKLKERELKMTKSTKVVSWTNDMTAELTATYTGDNTKLAEIAKTFGKTVPMVRSKLVSEGIYKANVKRSVGNASSTRKLDFVRTMETLVSMPRGSLDSFEKGSKSELDAFVKALIAMSTSREVADAPKEG